MPAAALGPFGIVRAPRLEPSLSMIRANRILVMIAALPTLALPVSAASPRFFFAGDGRLVLRHAYFENTLDVRYRQADGTYDPAALKQIEHFFRSREDGREAPIPLRLIELLSYVEQHYHPRQMVLLSGYRSPEFNADLRNNGRAAAQASLHTDAMAADIMFVGLDMRRLWRQLRDLGTGGVGYYRANKFLHIDTGQPRFWEASTSRVSENLSAGNARVFLRTDFDRYQRLEGAICSLHSVTAFPLRIHPHATLVGPGGWMTLMIEPVSSGIRDDDGCFLIADPAERYEFRVVSTDELNGAVASSRSRIMLSTCEPREAKTPAEIASNPLEIVR